MFKLFSAPIAALLVAGAAHAGEIKTLTLHERSFNQDTFGVQATRNPVLTIAEDAVYGGAAGLVMGAGVALISGDNLFRSLAVGTGIGILVGGVVGAITSTNHSDQAIPIGEHRDIGFSGTYGSVSQRF